MKDMWKSVCVLTRGAGGGSKWLALAFMMQPLQVATTPLLPSTQPPAATSNAQQPARATGQAALVSAMPPRRTASMPHLLQAKVADTDEAHQARIHQLLQGLPAPRNGRRVHSAAYTALRPRGCVPASYAAAAPPKACHTVLPNTLRLHTTSAAA